MTHRFGYARFVITSGLMLGLVTVSACTSGTVQDTLGLNRQAPDEFRVVSRPPLTVPPEFSLMPPVIKEHNPNYQPTTEQAKELVLKSEPVSSSSAVAKTSADQQFLKNIGANYADPEIRKQLVEERIGKQLVEETESWWDILSTDPEPKDAIVNAQKEAERIQKREDGGEIITGEDTPVVKPRDLGILGRILED